MVNLVSYHLASFLKNGNSVQDLLLWKTGSSLLHFSGRSTMLHTITFLMGYPHQPISTGATTSQVLILVPLINHHMAWEILFHKRAAIALHMTRVVFEHRLSRPTLGSSSSNRYSNYLYDCHRSDNRNKINGGFLASVNFI